MKARDYALRADELQQRPTREQLSAAVEVLRLLADPTRLRLMGALAGGQEVDVATLTEAVGVARPLVSQHLARLRLAGLVAARREGRRQLYRSVGGHVRMLVEQTLYLADHLVSGDEPHD